MPDAYLLIGEITKPQGVHGELKARPITCDPDRFYELSHVFLLQNGAYVPRNVSVRSAGPEAVFFRMEGVNTREDAETMRGTQLFIDREHAVPLSEDENFIVDLVGCHCVDSRGKTLGQLREVLQPGGNDVYVIASPRGDILVPALKIVVRSVDVDAKQIVFDADRLQEVAVFPDSEEVR